jgi:POT family proton-dependent oligopeptide transporter
LLAQIYGWHAGFGLAGVLMLIGLATYVAGYRALSEATPAANRAQPSAPIDAAQLRAMLALFAVMALTVFQSIAYYQNSNIGLVWIADRVDLGLFGFTVPVAWFNSIDSFVSIVCVPPLVALWRLQASRGGEPNEIVKIATGALIACAANLVLVLGCLGGGRVGAIYPVVYDILLGIAFLYYWPTLLALVSRAAPAALKSTLMGFAFLTLFLSNTLIGRLGALYEHVTPLAFWSLHAAVAGVGAALALLLNRPLGRLLSAGAPR